MLARLTSAANVRTESEEMYVSVTIARAVVDELQRAGISAERLCEHAGIPSAELAESSRRISIDRYNKLLCSARELSQIPSLGLRVGASAPMGALSVVGYILATCGTIREAFSHFVHYSPLIKEGGSWQIIEEGERARFLYRHDVIAPENARFDAEAALSLVLKIGRQFVGADKDPLRVCFRHAAPSYVDEYAEFFRSPVEFEKDTNELVFARHLLDVEQIHRDERVQVLLKERAEQMLDGLRAPESFVEHLRDLVRLEVESGSPRVSRIAERLGVTVRSLERQARHRGLVLSKLMEDARRDAACAALRYPVASIKDIAYRLGFSEPSAFHRAFKRWTGMTPAQYRETLGGAQMSDKAR